jgi:hypothetical protein
MATWVAETCQRRFINKITSIKAKCICWSFKNIFKKYTVFSYLGDWLAVRSNADICKIGTQFLNICEMLFTFKHLSLILLTWRIWWAPNNASNWQIGLNLLAPELFLLILAHPVYKMWIIQETNMLKLWNKLHFEEKKRRVCTMFKIFSTHIYWINI